MRLTPDFYSLINQLSSKNAGYAPIDFSGLFLFVFFPVWQCKLSIYVFWSVTQTKKDFQKM